MIKGRPILHPAQFTLHPDACIVASLQRGVPAQMIFGSILEIQKAIEPLAGSTWSKCTSG